MTDRNPPPFPAPPGRVEARRLVGELGGFLAARGEELSEELAGQAADTARFLSISLQMALDRLIVELAFASVEPHTDTDLAARLWQGILAVAAPWQGHSALPQGLRPHLTAYGAALLREFSGDDE